MKKATKITLYSLIIIPLIAGFSVFSYFWYNWYNNSENYMKQTEVYFNTLMKFTNNINTYQYIGNNKSSYYPMYLIKIFDRNKKFIGSIKTNNKIIVPLEKVSRNFISALISTEDRSFYSHKGVSFTGILRAFFTNIANLKFVEGGSTITQQLSKLLFTNQERTLKRKFNELFSSLSIEKYYTKEDILFMYTNLIFFGYNIYGVGLASRAYFNKDVSELSVPEAALLVSLISNPSFYNPYKHLENLQRKHFAVLSNMAESGYITKEQAVNYYREFWRNPTLVNKINISKEVTTQDNAPYVVEEVKRFLVREYGDDYADKIQGSQIYTTIDLDLQKYAENTNQTDIRTIRKMADLTPAEQKKVESAYVTSQPTTGEILSFSGGTEFTDQNQYDRAFQAKRQVGSTIKPFLYIVGLDSGVITPYTIFQDVPIEVVFKDKSIWDVNNYAKSYRGFLNVIDAIRRSSNVIAVQAADKIGLTNLQQFFQNSLQLNYAQAQKMFPDYQYSIVLGAVQLTPLQLNQLYQIIANNGVLIPLHFVSKIEDLKGKIIYEHTSQPVQIISREASFLMKGILKQVFSSGGSGNYIQRLYHFGIDIAGKSGTTQKNRDVWFAGFTNSLVSTVWIGQDDDKPLGNHFVGGVQAGEIFGKIMIKALETYPTTPFKADKSYNLTMSPVDLLTGMLPTENSLFKTTGLFIKGTQPKKAVNLSHKEQIRMALEKKILTPAQAQIFNRKEEPPVEKQPVEPILNKNVSNDDNDEENTEQNTN